MSAFRVALTFDAEHPDRPTEPGATERLLDGLERDGVRATFFVQGRWVEAYPGVARRIAGAGHLIGNHSHYHARMPLLSARGVRADVTTAEAVIRDVLGVDPRPWFRLPFGEGATDARLLARLAALGYRDVGWDVDALDWEAGRTAAGVEATVVDGALARGDGAVVLQHPWTLASPAALPAIVERLRAGGARFVRLDELVAPPSPG